MICSVCKQEMTRTNKYGICRRNETCMKAYSAVCNAAWLKVHPRQKAKWKKCKICGGRVISTNASRICQRTDKCRKAYRKSPEHAAKIKAYNLEYARKCRAALKELRELKGVSA